MSVKEKEAKPKYASREVVALDNGFAAGGYRKKGEKFAYAGPEARWLKEPKAAKPKDGDESKGEGSEGLSDEKSLKAKKKPKDGDESKGEGSEGK
jgi:hypothetical protein